MILKRMEQEFKALHWPTDEKSNKFVCKNVKKIIELISKQRHSDTSLSYIMGLVVKLVARLPLSPLTGEDWEWEQVSGDLFQNIRCDRVFKNSLATWDVEGKLYRSAEGKLERHDDSSIPVTFPYYPKTEIVDYESEADGGDIQ